MNPKQLREALAEYQDSITQHGLHSEASYEVFARHAYDPEFRDLAMVTRTLYAALRLGPPNGNREYAL